MPTPPLPSVARASPPARAANDLAPDLNRPKRGRPRLYPVPPLCSTTLLWLPARERELATIIYTRGELSAREAGRAVAAPLTDSAIRTMLRRLEAKGVVVRRKVGKKFLYAAAIPDQVAREGALRRLSLDYFNGSLQEAALALLLLVDEQQPGVVRSLSRRLRHRRGRRAELGGTARLVAVPPRRPLAPDAGPSVPSPARFIL